MLVTVLGCKEKSGVIIRQEWDVVLVPTPNPNPTIEAEQLVFSARGPRKVRGGEPDNGRRSGYRCKIGKVPPPDQYRYFVRSLAG